MTLTLAKSQELQASAAQCCAALDTFEATAVEAECLRKAIWEVTNKMVLFTNMLL